MVFHLDGRNASVILQGKTPSLSVIIPFSISLVLHLQFGVNACCFFFFYLVFVVFVVSYTFTEEDDRDLSCVVSSLVQLMLDPHYRSLTGFQSLVQKEWVMAGHRFLDRCNHLKKNDKEEVFT